MKSYSLHYILIGVTHGVSVDLSFTISLVITEQFSGSRPYM